MKTAICLSSWIAVGAAAAIPSNIPDFVINYAPIVYLTSSEAYRPADIGTHLQHTQPKNNFADVTGAASLLTLDNLSSLNGLDGNNVYLTSQDDVEQNPAWLFGVTPDASGMTNGAVSSTIIVNDHGNGLVDAFYMYFYSFDFGGVYFDYFNIGNHVGDWEHNMIRFQDGQPQTVWYSQHANGEAFDYDVLEKFNGGVRPVTYCANGTHANYATNGTHDHTIPNLNLPGGPIEDFTEAGPVWDPTLSAYFVQYDAGSQAFTAYDSSTPTDWLNFIGKWGDKQYPDSDPRQKSIFKIKGTYKYVDGPTGPRDKQLNRTQVCPDNANKCIIRPFLTP